MILKFGPAEWALILSCRSCVTVRGDGELVDLEPKGCVVVVIFGLWSSWEHVMGHPWVGMQHAAAVSRWLFFLFDDLSRVGSWFSKPTLRTVLVRRSGGERPKLGAPGCCQSHPVAHPNAVSCPHLGQCVGHESTICCFLLLSISCLRKNSTTASAIMLHICSGYGSAILVQN